MAEPTAADGTTSALPPPSPNGSASARPPHPADQPSQQPSQQPAGSGDATMIGPAAAVPNPGDGVAAGGGARALHATISPERIPPRLSFNPAHSRRRAVDGGWCPQTRDAGTELPALIAALDSLPGERVSRLAVHADDWDDIPDRLPGGGRHAIRVDWFTTIPRHTISVTADAPNRRWYRLRTPSRSTPRASRPAKSRRPFSR